MKILFLTQWFQPEPFFKGLPFAKALQDRGHDVEVLTGFPNYPGGRLYPGYRIVPWKNEDMEGVAVHRVSLYPSHDRSGTKRILNYLSFSLSSATLGPFLVHKPDIVYVYNLVTLVPVARMIRALHSCPIVIDVQDLWPDSVQNSGMLRGTNLNTLLTRYCLSAYRHATHLVVLSQGMKAELISRGVPEKHISVIYNWCDEGNIRSIEKDAALSKSLNLEGKFIVMFAGTIGIMQGLDTVLDAASLLKASYPSIKIVLVGDGVERARLKRLARQKELTNICFMDRQPPEAMSRILSLADVMLVHLKDKALFRYTIPSKVQAYMAAAKPVLLAVRGDAADIIQASGGGVVVEPDNPKALARGIVEMHKFPEFELKRMGASGARYYLSNMSLAAGVKKFNSLFCSLHKH